MKIILGSFLFLILAGGASAQGASAFVKGDGAHCFADVSDVVHRHWNDVDDEQAGTQILRAGHFSTAGGDMWFQIQTTTEKNKKGEEVCHIYVDVVGGGSLAHDAQATEVLNGRSTIQVANMIGAEVEGMKKAREKKAKSAS